MEKATFIARYRLSSQAYRKEEECLTKSCVSSWSKPLAPAMSWVSKVDRKEVPLATCLHLRGTFFFFFFFKRRGRLPTVSTCYHLFHPLISVTDVFAEVQYCCCRCCLSTCQNASGDGRRVGGRVMAGRGGGGGWGVVVLPLCLVEREVVW